MTGLSRVAVAVVLALLLAGCGGGGDGQTTATGTTQERASSTAQASETPAGYRTGASGSGETTTITVNDVIDPAQVSAPWGAAPLSGARYVVADLTLTADSGNGFAVAGSCITGTDSEGDDTTVWMQMTTEGGTPLGGLLDAGTPMTGQIAFEVPDGRTLRTITTSCGDPEQDAITVTVS